MERVGDHLALASSHLKRLIVSLQREKELLLQYPDTEASLIALDYEKSKDLDGQQHNGNHQNNLERGSEHGEGEGVYSTTLTPGQFLEGTSFKVLNSSQFSQHHPI